MAKKSQTQEKGVEGEASLPASTLSQLLARRAELQDEASRVQGTISELQARERGIHSELDRLLHRIEQLQPTDDNAVAIQAFVQREHENRQASNARLRELQSMGVQGREMASRRSPLDRAIANRKRNVRVIA